MQSNFITEDMTTCNPSFWGPSQLQYGPYLSFDIFTILVKKYFNIQKKKIIEKKQINLRTEHFTNKS